MASEKKEIKTIGVLTSGGDAPGMNAAIRAVVRRGLGRGLKVYGIYRGYDGLMEEDLKELTGKDVSDTIQKGGTVLYTARCAEMRTLEGQKHAAETCRKYGIEGLVVTTVSERGILTLERIKVALTGRCETASFLSVWEEIINEKRALGKAGTAENYGDAYRCFKRITGFTYADGFALDSAVINKWIDGMTERNIKSSTQGIQLRACRVVVNRCIGEGYMMPKAYMFGKTRDKIKIPAGSSRKGWFLSVEQMTELYLHWKNHDIDFPIHNTRRKDNPSYAIKDEKSRTQRYQALALFLMQYLCCGCNLYDLALLRYSSYYFESNGRAFRFIRHKTEDETVDGEGMEVIVPIIAPLQELLDNYAAEPKLDQLVFPFIAEGAISVGEERVRRRVSDVNGYISDRMKKVSAAIGWTVSPTGTYARHSFATNLHAAKVPRDYISDAMGHSLGNRGQITMRYISPWTIEDRITYNNLLLDLGNEKIDEPKENATIFESGKQAIFEKMHSFSEADLKEALIMLKKKELQQLEQELVAM